MANYMWLVATKNQEEFRDPDRLINYPFRKNT
jgi:hypothetical protein